MRRDNGGISSGESNERIKSYLYDSLDPCGESEWLKLGLEADIY